MEGGFVGSQSDPGEEGFVQESMWQVGVSGSGGGGDGPEIYPERPDEADCKYYLRTGVCGYGSKCRFNHPPVRSTVFGAVRLGGGELPQRAGQPACKYYMMTGTCKFGTSCKYHHPRQGDGTRVSLNYSGYPLRLGEKECAYYVKTGQCKFGVTCKFHHPQSADVSETTASPAAPGIYPPQVQPPLVPAAQTYGVVTSNWQVARQPTLVTYPFVQGPYGPMLVPHGMVPMPGWPPFQAHMSHGYNPLYGVSQLSSSAAEYTRPYSSAPVGDGGLPERPGKSECQYYLKTGGCKYGSSCRYHHPPEFLRPKATSGSLANLPIRPGAASCIYYAQYGVCKYGSACKYDHTSRAGGALSQSPSASSLTVGYLAVGSSTGTLAADSFAVSRKDSSPTGLTSSSM